MVFQRGKSLQVLLGITSVLQLTHFFFLGVSESHFLPLYYYPSHSHLNEGLFVCFLVCVLSETCLFLLFVQFDKFSSIRMPGSKKDRPALPHLKQSHSSSSECTTPAEMDNFSPTPLSDREILALFEKMMEDMNLNEDRKAPLREKDFSIKKEMVLQYTSAASRQGSLKNRKQILPQEFIYELKSGTVDEKLVSCLESLRVSLTSNPVSWVENFGREGLGLLLDLLERLYGLERIMSEERSFSLLAKTIDPKHINMMTDAVKLLSAICIIGEENILEKILKALTTEAEERGIDRFGSILKGLEENSVHLQVTCMQFINALVTTPDDLDFRLHIRNEFMRCGLKERLPLLRCIRNEALDIQLKFVLNLITDANDVFNLVWKTVKDTSAENYFLSILQHLLLIRNDNFIRPLYFKLIEECISQVVLHRSGLDPDFSYRKRLDVNFSHILGRYFMFPVLYSYESSHLKKKELLPRFHINYYSSFLPCFLASLLPSFTGTIPPPPPPPPLPPAFASGSKNHVPVGIPPPPPLLHGLPGSQCFAAPQLLPFGLKPKKEFKPEVTMKRVNWSKIRPQEMTENCFWVMANDGKYESTDLLCKLELTFCCQKNGKLIIFSVLKPSFRKHAYFIFNKHLQSLSVQLMNTYYYFHFSI
uniref:GBD/FH3 domain-containing protein n=1 Tax=Naja naja TaxID=35670 RepID=A0A8C6Y7M0_NAJNA